MKKTLLSILMLFSMVNASAQYPDLQGKIVKEIKYSDKTGDNVIVLTQTNKSTKKCEDFGECSSQDLYAYRYLIEQGSPKKIWQIHDFVHDCGLDMSVDFYANLVQLTDLNKNQIKEVWIPYTVACAGDISAYSKIIMYENMQKHASRGDPAICYGENNERIDGEYKMDKALQQNSSLRKFTRSLWKKISAEHGCKK